MGIRDLSKLIERYARKSTCPVTLDNVKGTRWAVDANIFMYRFMSAKPHYDGRHVERFRRFVEWMQAHEIEPIFVFDGDSPEEKKRELKTRREQKKKATSNLRDLQQGMVVLRHLDWRRRQLETVFHAITLLVPHRDDNCLKDNETETSFVFDALYQLVAEVLEWATETYLPTRLVQEHFEKIACLSQIGVTELPSLVRFMAFVRLRRHTPHMVELDWMSDPASATLGMFKSNRDAKCANENKSNQSNRANGNVHDESNAYNCTRFHATCDRNTKQYDGNDKNNNNQLTAPIVLIGGGDVDDLDNSTDFSVRTLSVNSTSENNTCGNSVLSIGVCNGINESTQATCRHNVAEETLKRLLDVSLASKRKISTTRETEIVTDRGHGHCNDTDDMPPFLLCVHCTRSVAKRLDNVITKYRQRVDQAWKNTSLYTMIVAVIVHKDAHSNGEWLLPSHTSAEQRVRKWQLSLRWPTKCQQKAANGANFDYYDWICSARSSDWWFDMQKTSSECSRMRFSNHCFTSPSYSRSCSLSSSSSSSSPSSSCSEYLTTRKTRTTSHLADSNEMVRRDCSAEIFDGDVAAYLERKNLSALEKRVTGTRNVCSNRCDLYTRAAATLVNRQLDVQNDSVSKTTTDTELHNAHASSEKQETTSIMVQTNCTTMEQQWDAFRSEQQRKEKQQHCQSHQRCENLSSLDEQAQNPEKPEFNLQTDDNLIEMMNNEKEVKNSCRPKKQRLACLESPNQRSFLVKRMQKQIDSLEPQVTRVTGEQLQQVQELLQSMSVLTITAEHEAEATCARLCRAGYSDWVVTEDFDALPFGAPYMLRRLRWTDIVLSNEHSTLDIPNIDNVTNSDKNRYTGGSQFLKHPSTMVIGELVNFRTVLQQLRMTPLEFIDLCILCGCDFCSSLPGVGFSVARDLILRYGCVENVVDSLDPTSRYGKGLRRFSVERAMRARQLFIENHKNALPPTVLSQINATK